MVGNELAQLLCAVEPQNRVRWALERKAQGKKVIGLGCSHIPEEIIHAAGILPLRLIGTWNPSLSLVNNYRPIAWTDPYVNHVLESAINGEYNYLDGMIATNWDEDRRQLYDYWSYLNITPFVFFVHLPRIDNELALQHFVYELRLLRRALEEHFQVQISDESIWESIRVYDKWRSLMMQIYRMRMANEPPLTGGEALRLSEASLVMPKDELIQTLEGILPELATRRASVKAKKPRLLVTGDMLDNPAYIDLIEEAGALVAFEDLEASSRYFWRTVEPNNDPLQALAKRYLVNRIPGPRFYFWERAIDQLIEWVREYHIDAVLNLPLRDSFQRLMGSPLLTRRLKEVGVKMMTFEIEYHLEMVGMLRTRVEAFLEVINKNESSGIPM